MTAASRSSEALSRASRFYGWPLVGVLWLVMAINLALPLYGASILNPYMAGQLHLGRGMIGVIYAVLMIMTGLPGPLVAMLIERVGVRWTMVIGNVMLVVGAVWMATAVHSGWQAILACGVVIGLSDCVGGPIPAQQAVAYWFVRRRSLAMAIILSGGSIGGFVAAPLLDRLTAMERGDWRAGWWLIAIAGVIATLLSALLVRDRPEDIGQLADGGSSAGSTVLTEGSQPSRRTRVYVTATDWTVGEALRSPTLWLLMLSALGFSCALTLVLAQGVTHMIDRGATPSAAAVALSASVIAGLIANGAVGALGDLVDPRLLWAASLVANTLGMILFVWVRPGFSLYATAALLGISGSGSMVCLITLLGNYYGAKAYAGVFGIASGIQSTLGALAPIAAGYVYDAFHTYAPVFDVTAALCFLGAMLLMFVVRPPRRPIDSSRLLEFSEIRP